MDNIKFNQTGGFPLDTDILGAMQHAYHIFNQLGSLAGDKAIISGCVVAGNNVSDGVIYLNGEVLPFKGGTLGDSIIIREDTESRIFEDGATKPIIFKRYATFGSSTPDKTYQWADFKRFDNLIENAEKNLDFDKRLKALENKEFPIPIGLVAIWYKPASEPIPKGWREYEPLRGRFPLGWNPNDEDFKELGKKGGDKTHTLTSKELPKIQGRFQTITNTASAGVFEDVSEFYAQVSGGNSAFRHREVKMSFGEDQPHNNMPPYRIIKFIEFVGFN